MKMSLLTHWVPFVCWLWSPANIKGANKDAKIYVGRSTTLHNLLFCPHTLCMNYVTNTFLLVNSSVWSKQLLCFVQGQEQESEQKHTTKNFNEFHNHNYYEKTKTRDLSWHVISQLGPSPRFSLQDSHCSPLSQAYWASEKSQNVSFSPANIVKLNGIEWCKEASKVFEQKLNYFCS